MAQQKARTATQKFHGIAGALAKAGARAIMQVRATAATSDDENIYSLAWLPKPKKASPVGEPGKPTDFQMDLTGIGTVKLKWKCKNPRNAEGTMYDVWRQVRRAGESQYGPSEYLGVTGKKSFEDFTIPAGAAELIHRVTAFRSTRRGSPTT